MRKLFSLIILSTPFLFTACDESRLCFEKIKEDCVCIQIYDPVCGCNNKTYGNACVAQCASITKYTPGECEKKLPEDNSKSKS